MIEQYEVFNCLIRLYLHPFYFIHIVISFIIIDQENIVRLAELLSKGGH